MRAARTATGLVLAAVLALSGCGGGSAKAAKPAAPKTNGVAALTAQQIVDKAEAAAKAAKAVHITGTATSDGETFSIDMKVGGAQGAQGTITFGGSTIEILRVGTSAYLKADPQFWGQLGDAAMAAKLGGKYVKGSTDDQQFKAFLDFTEIDKIFSDLLSNSGKISKVAGKPVDGTPTVGVNDADKQDGGTLYVATTGQPYPLLIEPNAGSGDTGSIRLVDWNKPITITTPPASQVIDLADLGG